MKNKTINWVGRQILENSDELEEGCVEMVVNIDDILDEIDDEDIEDYAKWNLNEYDYVDSCLFEDISSVFDSLSVFDRQKLRDIVVNYGR